MDVRYREREKDEDQQPLDGAVTVTVHKGPSGSRSAQLGRERVRELSNRQLVEAFAQQLDGDDRAFAEDVRAMLADGSWSLERIESGRQTRWVNRDDPVEADVIEQEQVRYVLSRDHHGG